MEQIEIALPILRFTTTAVNSIDTFSLFTPEFLKWTLLSLNVDMSPDANRSFNFKSKDSMASNVAADETACYEVSVLVCRAERDNMWLITKTRLFIYIENFT